MQTLKSVFARNNLSKQCIDISTLRQTVSLVDEMAFGSAAFELWSEAKSKRLTMALSEQAVQYQQEAVQKAILLASGQPVLIHHVKQRLRAIQSQMYASVIGAGSGELLTAPLLQLSDKKRWDNGVTLQRTPQNKSARFELDFAMDWTEKYSLDVPVVHWVEEHTNQLWQTWQQSGRNVFAVVSPSTKCWSSANEYTTPSAIAEKLEFYAVNYAKMPLPYQRIFGEPLSGNSFWYAEAPVVLRSRGGKEIKLLLYVFKIVDTRTMQELRTLYVFCSTNPSLVLTPEKVAVWLLQHTESKSFLRYTGRAYHHRPLGNFVKRLGLDQRYLLELAVRFGGTVWELSQYRRLRPVNQLLLVTLGEKSLDDTQFSSSLLKLFRLKAQLGEQKTPC